MPRNGVGSGQVVLTDQEGLRDVSAKIGPLKGPAGVLPAGAVEIRYAGPSPEIVNFPHVQVHYCDALLPKPPAAAKTLPAVWTIVQAPKDQAPGWYTGTLEINARRENLLRTAAGSGHRGAGARCPRFHHANGRRPFP